MSLRILSVISLVAVFSTSFWMEKYTQAGPINLIPEAFAEESKGEEIESENPSDGEGEVDLLSPKNNEEPTDLNDSQPTIEAPQNITEPYVVEEDKFLKIFKVLENSTGPLFPTKFVSLITNKILERFDKEYSPQDERTKLELYLIKARIYHQIAQFDKSYESFKSTRKLINRAFNLPVTPYPPTRFLEILKPQDIKLAIDSCLIMGKINGAAKWANLALNNDNLKDHDEIYLRLTVALPKIIKAEYEEAMLQLKLIRENSNDEETLEAVSLFESLIAKKSEIDSEASLNANYNKNKFRTLMLALTINMQKHFAFKDINDHFSLIYMVGKANESNVSTDALLQASEVVMNIHESDPQILAKLYLKIAPLEGEEELVIKNMHNKDLEIDPYRVRGILYKLIISSASTDFKARYLKALWHYSEDIKYAIAPLLSEEVEKLKPTTEILWFAKEAIEILLSAESFEKALEWQMLLEHSEPIDALKYSPLIHTAFYEAESKWKQYIRSISLSPKIMGSDKLANVNKVFGVIGNSKSKDVEGNSVLINKLLKNSITTLGRANVDVANLENLFVQLKGYQDLNNDIQFTKSLALLESLCKNNLFYEARQFAMEVLRYQLQG